MKILAKYQNQNAILRISGDILGDARVQLNEKIQEVVEGGSKNIVLNLNEVGLMDSVGLGMLVALQTSLKRQGIQLVLSNVGKSVEYLLTITKLNRVFDRYETEDEALVQLQS